MIRATSFAKKSIVKSFNFEKLAKIREKRDSLKHRRELIQESWKLSYFGRKKHLGGIHSKPLNQFSVRSFSLAISRTDCKSKNF